MNPENANATNIQRKPIKRLLVANRGEIACRIFRTAGSLGITTIAVYSEADANALHTKLADECHPIGPAEVQASYLNIEAIVSAAIATGADAVHPGYGFLSENAAFAQALADAGITFVGPSANAIEAMGDKRQAKRVAENAGLPTLPGIHTNNATDDELIQAATAIGFPVMVKAAHGGGGRGMRLAHDIEGLKGALTSARAEAQNAFGRGELLLEKALTRPRHIEVQIFADKHGNCVYMGDRDCSVQRRHQKVVEEAPAANLPDGLRARMGEASIALAKSCQYLGAGTVEFLVEGQDFYFLEMNTRLQVEHPVTEAVFQEDLVAWQLAIAEGLPLPKQQAQLIPSGHAIEVRLYAEDPAQQFFPQTGKILHWQPCNAQAGMRTDHMLYDGAQIGNWYDPMLAKIIAQGFSRRDAINKLRAQIRGTLALGINHNLGFLTRILEHDAFQAAPPGTDFLECHNLTQPRATTLVHAHIAAALVQFLEAQPTAAALSTAYGNLSTLSIPNTRQWQLGNNTQDVLLDARTYCEGLITLTMEGTNYPITHIDHSPPALTFKCNGERISCFVVRTATHYYLQLGGEHFTLQEVSSHASSTHAQSSGDIKAPMAGQVLEVLITSGEQVNAGDTLLIIEAMKMEMPLKATSPGRYTITVQKGEQVSAGQTLAEPLEPHVESPSPGDKNSEHTQEHTHAHAR
ncbi:biotin/lipoyl-binding protein [Simiduia sp. 21SJ11W-1]|uniref:acetyl/propionyl/methylcrotonyl-CoA carboxylase subunit alpha n=1 Tax=Simiduia sp. 21SJ11W-1 TaxID=2909669 RepID=UPI00209F4601|nr:biotin carboxylase N-terminal domain-containing protein [Simiduia sp. 21SJ11W-1]UTA46412.1 biotin/lipoyl-binding protein [Simiduia sp. 21SJ11W-1]